jgi:hypothetical protein
MNGPPTRREMHQLLNAIGDAIDAREPVDRASTTATFALLEDYLIERRLIWPRDTQHNQGAA